MYARSADEPVNLSIKLGSLYRHIQYQDFERGAGADPELL